MKRNAFSLVELIVVLTISTLVIAVVTMNWSASLYNVSIQSAVESYMDFDEVTRRHATSNSKPCTIRFDHQSSDCSASRWNNGSAHVKKLQLGDKSKISFFGPGDSAVLISAEGNSRSYYVAVTVKEKTRWIFFYGGTGQSRVFQRFEDVQIHMQAIDESR